MEELKEEELEQVSGGEIKLPDLDSLSTNNEDTIKKTKGL